MNLVFVLYVLIEQQLVVCITFFFFLIVSESFYNWGIGLGDENLGIVRGFGITVSNSPSYQFVFHSVGFDLS